MPTRNKHRVKIVPNARHNGRYRRFQLSSYTVALHGFAVFFTDGKSHLALLVVAVAVEQYKIFVGNARRVLVHVVVLIVLFKSVDRLQSEFLYADSL